MARTLRPAREQTCQEPLMEEKVRGRLRMGNSSPPTAMESHITDITRVIQLAVAPVFLLTAIGTLIAVLNVRLGRNVDRRRLIEEELRGAEENKQTDEQRARQRELQLLARRIRLIYFAMLSAGLGALLVCLVVAGAFVGALVAVDISREVAVLFILAMFAVIGCLSMFLREVFLAVTAGGHKIP
jgi:hypothetical protein